MARAACREPSGADFVSHCRHDSVPVNALRVLDITVPSLDAFRVRRMLAAFRHACVLRCIPLPHRRQVRLEIQLPENAVDAVMHLVIGSIPSGEIGALRSSRRYSAPCSSGSIHGF